MPHDKRYEGLTVGMACTRPATSGRGCRYGFTTWSASDVRHVRGCLCGRCCTVCQFSKPEEDRANVGSDKAR